MADVRLEECDGGVRVLWLDRPAKLNALSDATVSEIGRVLDEVAASSCRVLVLTGAGRGFCAGFDLQLAGDAPGSEAGETQAWMRRQEAFAGLVTRFRALPQPIVAVTSASSWSSSFVRRWNFRTFWTCGIFALTVSISLAMSA